MALDVESPDPPDLTNRGLPREFDSFDELESQSDLHRGELEDILLDGAWSEGFREWAEYTDLSEDEYRSLHEYDLFQEMDFYWDPVDDRLRFELPTVPEELSDQKSLWSKARAELTDLGDTVLEVLEDSYVDWGDEDDGYPDWNRDALDDESPPDD